MLLYDNRSFFRLLFETKGSVVWERSAVVSGCFLAVFSVLLQWMHYQNTWYSPFLSHHYGMHALGVVVAFTTVFRTNLCWHRYWEAITHLHVMYSKWEDAFSGVYAFASVSLRNAKSVGDEDKVRRLQAAMRQTEADFCLLSALSVQRLYQGDTERMRKRRGRVGWQDLVVERSVLKFNDMTGATQMPFLDAMETADGSPTFATQQMDLSWNATKLLVKRIPDPAQQMALQSSGHRPNMVMHWILVSLSRMSPDLDIAPPIQTRVYQELSNGMLGFVNALKIADVPFPFPYAQLLNIMLFFYSLFIPLYVSLFTKSMFVSPVVTFLLFQGVWCVNAVAKDLENPFGTDTNDINVLDFHARFVEAIVEVARGSEVDMASTPPKPKACCTPPGANDAHPGANGANPAANGAHPVDDVFAVDIGPPCIRPPKSATSAIDEREESIVSSWGRRQSSSLGIARHVSPDRSEDTAEPGLPVAPAVDPVVEACGSGAAPAVVDAIAPATEAPATEAAAVAFSALVQQPGAAPAPAPPAVALFPPPEAPAVALSGLAHAPGVEKGGDSMCGSSSAPLCASRTGPNPFEDRYPEVFLCMERHLEKIGRALDEILTFAERCGLEQQPVLEQPPVFGTAISSLRPSSISTAVVRRSAAVTPRDDCPEARAAGPTAPPNPGLRA